MYVGLNHVGNWLEISHELQLLLLPCWMVCVPPLAITSMFVFLLLLLCDFMCVPYIDFKQPFC